MQILVTKIVYIVFKIFLFCCLNIVHLNYPSLILGQCGQNFHGGYR